MVACADTWSRLVVCGYRCEENGHHGSGGARAGEDRLGRACPGMTGGEADSEGDVHGTRQSEQQGQDLYGVHVVISRSWEGQASAGCRLARVPQLSSAMVGESGGSATGMRFVL